MPADSCPCGCGPSYGDCCGRFVDGKQRPPTAELLMRSRYSAYVKKAVDYLVNTTHPSNRKATLAQDIAYTADNYTWLSLHVADVQGGAHEDSVGKVEFIAHFRALDGQIGVHHERSRFKKYAGGWYYLDGVTLSG